MKILSRMNLEAHQGRPLTPVNKKLTIWKPSKDFIHCCIASSGCRFNRECGACIMCDYGIGNNLTPAELEKALKEELAPCMEKVTTLLFGSYGSIMDTDEVSEECFDVILKFIESQKVQTVIFETHCSAVNKKILDKLQKKILHTGIRIIVEMGYESCDTYVLENCLNKVLDLNQLIEVIDLIHEYSMEVSLNVFLGAPFLNEREQLNTTLESVKWAFEKGADSIVIFPCNIKPFTLLYRLYRHDLYRPISQWMLVELLTRIPEDKLNRITLSWYGDRENFYENGEFPLIPPEDCEECHDDIFAFYQAFMKENNAMKRKGLVETILQKEMSCECRSKFRRQIKREKIRLNVDEIRHKLEEIE